MEKINRYISFEILFAILFIIAFFLPWLDWGMIKIVGWDIPDIQKKITKVSNFFSRNKESVYTTYIVYLIPILSLIVFSTWLALKKKTARALLMTTGILAFIVSLNLFYKLPKAGSGVYLLCGTSILSIVYLIFIYRRNRKQKEKMLTEIPDSIEEELDNKIEP